MNKSIKLLIICSFVFIVFHKVFENWILTFLVAPILCYFEPSILADIFVSIFTINIIIIWIKKSQKYNYNPSPEEIYFAFIISFIYSLYRFHFWTPFYFFHFESTTKIVYLDLIYILCLVRIYVWILVLFCKKNEVVSLVLKNHLSIDKPLNPEIEEERLGFTNYANRITEIIVNHKNSHALGIGVVAPWGYGKTSFIKLIQYNLTEKKLKQDLIWINFDPWKSNSSESIIEDFFKQLELELVLYSGDLKPLLKEYSNKLKSLPISGLKSSYKPFADMIFPEKSINELKTSIEETIKKIGKNIVIFIDDLDRSKSNEIWEILKLIRNTANFSNTVYLVAYDKAFILHQLKMFNNKTDKNILEKIFQLEITLPGYGPSQLGHILIDKLRKTGLEEIVLERFSKSIFESGIKVENSFNEWVTSIRDVNRLYNSIVMNVLPMIHEVSIHDFLRLEYLRINFPEVHTFIFIESGNIFESSKNSPPSWTLKTGQSGEIVLTELLKKRKESFHLKDEQIPKIVALMNNIFSRIRSIYLNETSVVNGRYFQLYFQFTIPFSILGKQEFLSCYNSGEIDKMKRAIGEWLKLGLQKNLQERLSVISRNVISSKEQFEFTVHTILFFICQPNHLNGWSDATCYFPKDDLMNLILDYNGEIINKFYFGKIETYKEFILSSLKNMSKNLPERNIIIREMILRQSLNSSHEVNKNDYPFSLIELEDILVLNLRQLINSFNNWDNILYAYCFECVYEKNKYFINGDRVRQKLFFESAKMLIVNFLNEVDLDGFLLRSINVSPRNGEYELSNLPLAIFGNWVAFKEFLYSQNFPKNKYLNEYLEFFEKCSFGEGNLSSSEFEFKIIPIGKEQVYIEN